MTDAATAAQPVRSGPSVPVILLAGLIFSYVLIFGTLTWKQQSNFATFGYDMGLYDQGIWLVSRFKNPFLTVRGLNYFGHHVNLITLLFVPAYWLGAGPHFLYVVETLAMAAGAIPVWLLARDRSDSAWFALAPATAFLLFPSLQWINWWHFHPDALIITPLLFAWWLASRRRWGWFVVAVLVALAAKEDAALAVLMMGLALALRGERKWGLRTAAAGIAWFVIATKVAIPIANGGKEPFYEEFFPGFGNSMVEIVWTMVRHPSRLYRVAFLADRLTYFRQMVLPLGGLSLLYAPALLIAAPQTVVNIISIHQPTHDIKYHYSSIAIAALFIGAVEASAWFTRRGRIWTVALGAYIVVCALAANVAWSPSPLGRDFELAWARGAPANHRAINQALALVRPDDKVTATYYLVPHLTHRQYIYEFPNPFVVTNWGVNGEDPPAKSTSNVLVLDTAVNGYSQVVYEELVAPDGPFRIVFERDGIVVARRKPGR